MEVTTTNPSDASTPSSPPPSAVRMMVINNSQIIASVIRAAWIVLLLALALQLLRRVIPPGQIKEDVKILDFGLFAVGIGLFVLNFVLERALRRCPVCRTRITSATEEK